jgi:hypothetical protein
MRRDVRPALYSVGATHNTQFDQIVRRRLGQRDPVEWRLRQRAPWQIP